MNKFNQGEFKNWDDVNEGNDIAMLSDEEVAEVAGARFIRVCYSKRFFGRLITYCYYKWV